MVGSRVFLTFVTVPLLILDVCAGVVGGIWLARDGYWAVIIMGFGLSFVALSITSAMSMPLAFLADSEARRTPTRAGAVRMAILSSLLPLIVMGGGAVAVFYMFGQRVALADALPAVLWSYSTATTAWMFLAQMQAHNGNRQGAFAVFLNQFGCASLIVYSLTHAGDLDALEMAAWFAAPVALGLIARLARMMASGARPAV